MGQTALRLDRRPGGQSSSTNILDFCIEGCVTEHAHAGQILLETFHFLFFRWTVPGHSGKACYFRFILVIAERLFFVHGHKIGVHRAAWKLILYFLFTTAQHDGLQPFKHPIEVLVAHSTSFLVQLVKLTVEAEQGAEDMRNLGSRNCVIE